jgi:hypothetical protein
MVHCHQVDSRILEAQAEGRESLLFEEGIMPREPDQYTFVLVVGQDASRVAEEIKKLRLVTDDAVVYSYGAGPAHSQLNLLDNNMRVKWDKDPQNRR